MKTLAKKALTSICAFGVVGVSAVNAIDFGEGKLNTEIKGANQTADVAVQQIVANITTFLYIIAVLLALWGGFQILTASGDEEKVKKGKNVLIQALIGLVVIFLAYSIISWLLNLILTP